MRQGSIPYFNADCELFCFAKVDLLATCPTLSSITASKKQNYPGFVMVSPTAKLMNLQGAGDKGPSNIFWCGRGFKLYRYLRFQHS